MPEASTYKDANEVRDAYRKGQLSKEQATKIIDESEFVIPGDPQSDPEAYEKQIRENVKKEDAAKAKKEAEGLGFFERIGNAVYRGYQGYRQTEMDPFEDPEKSDFYDISEAAAIQKNLPMGKGLEKFYRSEGFGEAIGNLFKHDYGGTLVELVAESMGAYLPTVAEKAPARAGAGATMGAGLGLLGGPFSKLTVPAGAAIGASGGMTETFGISALSLEYSSIILAGLEKKGVDVTNPAALEAAFTDPEVIGDLRSEGIKGGIPVALFDMFTGRLGGRFLSSAKKAGTSKGAATIKEFGVQGAGGASGEATKSVVLGEEISAPGVVGEFFGEGPTSIPQIAQGFIEDQMKGTKAPAKDTKVPNPKDPEKFSYEIPLKEETEVDADTSLDEMLDQADKPKPDPQQKAEEVNQAEAEAKETSEPAPAPTEKTKEVKQEETKQKDPAPAQPQPKEKDSSTVVPDAAPEQQEQAAKEQVQDATERAADQPDPDSIPANQDVYNALHKYARLAKKQGKTLEQWAAENEVEINDAVRTAWDDADNETPAPIDELPPEVNAALGDNNVRNRAIKFANADLSDETLGGVNNVGYEKRNNESDAEYAQRDIQEKGLSGAVNRAVDKNDSMSPAQKTIYQAEVLQSLRDDEKAANAEGDTTRADQRVNEQISLIESINESATNAGQYLQAFNHFSKLSVGGMLRYAKRAFEKIAGKKITDAKEAFKRVRDTLRDTEEQVVNEIINETKDKLVGNDPRVRNATRKQVGELVAAEEKPETAEIVRQHFSNPDGTTLAQKFESSGMDPATAKREARRVESKYKRKHSKVSAEIKKRIAKVLNKMPLWKRYKNETIASLARAINPSSKKTTTPALQSFANRLANNLRKHLESLRPNRKSSMDKLTDEQILAEGILNLDKYEQVWLETQQELRDQENLSPEQIAELDQIFNEGSPMPFSASTIDRAIRASLVRLGQNLDKVIKENKAGQSEVRSNVIDDIIARTGLEGKNAEILADMLNKRYQELSTKRKRAALKKLNRTDGTLIPTPIKRKYEKIIEWSNLGMFSDSQFDEELSKRLDLPVLTEDLKRRIKKQAEIIESMPEGFQKQREAIKMMDMIAGEKNFGIGDLFWDFWFANVLSGLSTQTINLLGSTINLAAHTIINFMRRPGDFGAMMKGIARGMRKGLSEGRAVLETGIITGTRLEKFEQSRNLELIDEFRGGKFNPLSYLKFVGRALSAGDMLFFKTAEEMKHAIMARNLAKKEKLSGKALGQRTDEMLNNTKAEREKATRQADKEKLTGLDRRRRIAELMEQGRTEPEEAKQYALRVIYSNKPYGALGFIADLVNKMNAEFPIFRMVAPFVNIVSNVTNESLNYFPPVGYGRWIQAKRKGQLYGQPLSENESVRQDQLGDQFGKSTFGTMAMASVGALAWSLKDDEDPWFMIHGSGPRDYGKSKTWKATGAVPYSIKINDTYIPYKDTVMAIPFAVVGSFLDGHRFNGMQDSSLTERLALAMTYSAGVITENSFLKGMVATSSIINQNMSGKRAKEVVFQQFSRTATGAAVPFGGLLRDMDRLQDPSRYDGLDIETMLYSQIPFVRRLNKPTLNVLGEPVKMHVSSRYWSTPQASEELRYLVEKNAYPSFPSRNSTVNLFGRDMKPDEFYDYIKISGEAIRKRIKTEVYDNRQLFNRLPKENTKLVVDEIVRQERAKAKSKLFIRHGR